MNYQKTVDTRRFYILQKSQDTISDEAHGREAFLNFTEDLLDDIYEEGRTLTHYRGYQEFINGLHEARKRFQDTVVELYSDLEAEGYISKREYLESV